MRQADRQISRSFAYVGGKSFLTGKSALSPGSESQADMPVIWAILQEYYPGVLSEHGADAQPSVIGADLLAGYWSGCDSLPQMGCLHVAWRQQPALRRCGEPRRCMEAQRAGWPHAPPQPLAVLPSIPLSIPLVLSSRAPCATPAPYQSSSRCQQMLSSTYGRLKPLHEV